MKKVIILCLTVLFFSPCHNAFAKTLTLVTGEWAPYTSESLEGYGFCSEVTTAVIKEMGMEAEYKFFPWKRCEHYVKSGKAWAALPYYKTEEREKNYAFTDSIITSRSVFFYYGEKLSGFDWKAIEDLKPYKMGGVLGYGNHEKYEKMGFHVDYAADEIMTLKKLKAGRVDIYPQDELVAREAIKNHLPGDIDKFKVLPTPEAEYPLYLIIDKTNEESVALIKSFNSALKRIKENGVYQAILKKYNMVQ